MRACSDASDATHPVSQVSEDVFLELLVVPEAAAAAAPPVEQPAIESGDRWPLMSSDDARATCAALAAGIEAGLQSLPDALAGASRGTPWG